jgi:heat shock protein HslJ
VRVSDAAGDHPISGAPTLAVEHGELTTSDGCNSLSGPVAVGGQQVTLKELSSTAIGCTGTVSTTAAVIDRVFSGHTVHEQVDGTTLTIKGDGAGALVYQWIPADAQSTHPANLTGRTWHLTSVAGEPAAGTVDLRVDRGGAFASSDGCNELNGIAHVGQGSLSVNIAARTQVGCPQAETILSFLNQKPALWSIRDGKLLIYGGGAQAFALIYTAGDPPAPAASKTASPPALVGKRWTLSGTEVQTTSSSGGSASGSSSSTPVVLIFDGRGGFRVQERCGDRSGTVVLQRRTADFTAGHFVPHSCPPSPDPAREQHDIALVDQVLRDTATWSIEGTTLTLTKGGTTLTFEG